MNTDSKQFKDTKELAKKIHELLFADGVTDRDAMTGPIGFNNNFYEIQIEDETNTYIISIQNVSLVAKK